MEDFLTVGASILGIGGGLVILILAVKQVQREEANESGEGWFRPVGITKFLMLTTTTIGTYSLYWFWRSWRRHRLTEDADIRPFWRTAFSVFWIVSLFQAANAKSETKWPIWIAIVATAVVFISSAVVQIGMREDVPFRQTEMVSALSTLSFIPLVMQINRVNTPEFVAERARFSKLDWWALACGMPFWLTLMIAG